MQGKRTHTRDFLVDRAAVDSLNTLPARWLARLLAVKMGEIHKMGCLEVGGLQESDCNSAPIHQDEEPNENLLAVVHFLGPYAPNQSYCRFSIVDHTPGSQIIAAARHMVTLGDTFQCEVGRPMPTFA